MPHTERSTKFHLYFKGFFGTLSFIQNDPQKTHQARPFSGYTRYIQFCKNVFESHVCTTDGTARERGADVG